MATNTVNVDAYRGAGRPEATYLLERTMETERQLQDLLPDPDLISKIPKTCF